MSGHWDRYFGQLGGSPAAILAGLDFAEGAPHTPDRSQGDLYLAIFYKKGLNYIVPLWKREDKSETVAKAPFGGKLMRKRHENFGKATAAEAVEGFFPAYS